MPLAPLKTAEKTLEETGRVELGAPEGWNPKTAGISWADEATIRGAFLSDYLRKAGAAEGAEIVIEGVCIEGDTLNIENATLRRAINFRHCEFRSRVYLANSHTREIIFNNCRIEQWLYFSHLTCNGSFYLLKCELLGPPSANNASIAGALVLNGSTIQKSEQDDKIGFQGFQIGQSLIARDFNTDCKLHLVSAKIGADIEISNSKISYNGDGSALDLRDANVGSNVNISQSLFKGPIRLDSARIDKSVQLFKVRQVGSKSRFFAPSIICRGAVRIIGSRIDGGVNIQAAKISSSLVVDRTLLGGNDDILSVFAENCFVDNDVIITKSRLQAGVTLTTAIIKGDLLINRSKLYKTVASLLAERLRVEGSIFVGPKVIAKGSLLLSGMKVGAGINLTFCKFEIEQTLFDSSWPTIDLKHVDVGNSLIIREGFECRGSIHLHNATINGDLQLASYSTSLNSIGELIAHSTAIKGALLMNSGLVLSSIDLRDAQAKSVVDAENFWPPVGHIMLDRFEYETFGDEAPTDAQTRIRWLKRQSPDHLGLKFKPNPFEQLALVLKRMGHELDAREVLIEKQILLRKAGRFGGFWPTIRHAAIGALIGYGFRPINSIIAATLCIFVGFFWFESAYSLGFIGPSKTRLVLKDEAIREFSPDMRLPAAYPSFNAFAYSVDAFLPVLDLQQETYWVPRTVNHLGHANPAYRWYYWFHTILGWIITTIGIAGFTGLIKRD